MKPCIIIPARYNSSRFPGKPLALIDGISLIVRVARVAQSVLAPEDVYVATDSELILQHCEFNNVQSILSSKKHITGTDRVAEVADSLKYDYFVNLQGDEPTVNPLDILSCIEYGEKYPSHVINFYHPIFDDDPSSKSLPKVVFNESNDLIYISRSVIPGTKSINPIKTNYYRQVCIYGYTFDHLKAFGDFSRKSLLEDKEDIEILRFFELSIPIKVFLSRSCGPAVDFPEDIQKVLKYLKN